MPDQLFPFSRVIVAGTSCAGKTTFAARLAANIGAVHIELDALHWAQDWQPKPPEEFRRLTLAAIKPERWVVDGNYGIVRDALWPNAELVCWFRLQSRTQANAVSRFQRAQSLRG